ncbi:hypothetical protein ACWFR5_12320 [Streptomyces sp. NPDC055092]
MKIRQLECQRKLHRGAPRGGPAAGSRSPAQAADRKRQEPFYLLCTPEFDHIREQATACGGGPTG